MAIRVSPAWLISNQDGKLDIIATMKKFTAKKSGQVDNARVFFWDIQNNEEKHLLRFIAGKILLLLMPPSSGTYLYHGCMDEEQTNTAEMML